MSIIRSEHNKNFVIMNKSCLQDTRLSWKAKGLYAYLMSLPDNWEIKTSEIVKHSPDGKTALLSGLKELIEFGYCEHTIKREKGKIISQDYLIKEVSQLDLGLLESENLNTANQTLLSNNSIKYDSIKDKDVTNVTSDVKNGFLDNELKEASAAEKKSKGKKKKKPRPFHPGTLGGKLAQYMLDEIEKHNPTFQQPSLGDWESYFNMMMFKQGKTFARIKNIIWFSQYSEFWKPFIINPYALNAKYETLKIQLMQLNKRKNSEREKENVFDRAKEDFFKKNTQPGYS